MPFYLKFTDRDGRAQVLPGPAYRFDLKVVAEQTAEHFRKVKNPAWNGTWEVTESPV